MDIFESHYYLFQFKCLHSTLSAFLSCVHFCLSSQCFYTLTHTQNSLTFMLVSYTILVSVFIIPGACVFFFFLYFYLLYDWYYVCSTLGYRCNMNYRAKTGAFEMKHQRSVAVECYDSQKHNSALFFVNLLPYCTICYHNFDLVDTQRIEPTTPNSKYSQKNVNIYL